MGGIVTKQFLIDENQAHGLTKGFYITLATPHQGVSEASALKFLGNIHIDELEPFSDRLEQLGNSWPDIAKHLNTCYYAALDDEIVNEKSSFPRNERNRLTIVEGTHTSICKPATADCALIKSLDLVIPRFLKIHSGNIIQSNDLMDHVLFQGYRPECEPYYLNRATDGILRDALINTHVWITGPNGCGKTVIGQHTIIQNSGVFFYVDASPCCAKESACAYLRTLYESIKTQSEVKKLVFPTSEPVLRSEDDILTGISNLLSCIPTRGTICVFVDEVPLVQGQVLKQFGNLLVALAAYHSNRMNASAQVRFIIATPTPAETFLDNSFKGKFDSMFSSFQLSLWSDEEIRRLLGIIFTNLVIRAPREEVDQLVRAAAGSPRRLKALARQYILARPKDGSAVARAISQVTAESI